MLSDDTLADDDCCVISNLTNPRLDDWDLFHDASLIRAHAVLMLSAWVGAGSIGMLIPRYFKRTWVKVKICGLDTWFFIHRALMLLTWVLSMTGFIIIFIDIDGWIDGPKAHEILGIITTILCFVQPIGATFRPDIDSPRRRYFNWIHAYGGIFIYFLAMVTIFFAVPLEKAKLPPWMSWIMTSFVVFYLFIHVGFMILGYKSDAIVTRGGGQSSQLDAPLATERKILLLVYVCVVIPLLLTLCITVCIAPFHQ